MDTAPHERQGSARVGPIAACLFASGLCALVYQTAWLREFRLVFGASTAASAAVLAIFMGGLGAGSVIFGRSADRAANPLRRYALLELAIAATAALTPPLLWAAREAYVALGGTIALGTGLGAALRVVLAAIVMLAPTVLMGGTLPAAVRAAQSSADRGRSGAALLYGVNAAGAVAGALLATFLLFEVLGNRFTLWSACALNAAVALAALHLSRGPAEAAPPAAGGDAGEAAAAPRAFVLAAAAVSGFAFFLVELVWYRMLGPLLGGSTFTFGLVLAIALCGIAIGSLALSRLRGARASTLAGFGAVCGAQAALVAAPYALGDRLVTLTIALQPLGSLGFAGRVTQWSVVAGIVVLPASILAGAQFPMLIALLGRGRDGVGRDTAHAYGWNTAGAIAGSLAGGFGLLPALGTPGAWRLVAAGLAALAVAALLLDVRRRTAPRRLLPGALAIAAAATLLTAAGPTAAWRHSPVGAGRVRLDVGSANAVEEFGRARRRSVRWEADGVESGVAVTSDSGYAFVVDGKIDGSARGDAPTQVMLGLIGSLLHEAPRDALVVGLGTGSTAGWLAEVPSIERVDVAELEPSIRTVAECCAPVNRGVLANPKVRLWFGDAREAMLTARDRYDVIASEPSNPYRAGVASLFTREFYEAAAARLRPKGLFVQWVQAYEVDGPSICGLYATLSSVFPAVETWQSAAGDLVFVASSDPIVHDVAELRRRVQQEPYRSALAWTWRVTDVEGVFGRYVGNEGLAQAAARTASVNTDDRNDLEFAFARTVGVETGFDVARLARVAQAHSFDRPRTRNGELDWTKLPDRRVSASVLDAPGDFQAVTGDPGFVARTAAKVAYAKCDLAATRAAWFGQDQEPGDLVELLLVAQCLAGTVDARAPGYAARLAKWLPHEAEAVMAQYSWLRNQPAEARAFAVKALAGYRTDPWARPIVMAVALEVATLAHSHPDTPPGAAASFAQSLAEPFVLGLLDGERMTARLNLARDLDAAHGTHLAVAALAEFEPHTPWNLEFLRARAETYERAGDPRAADARADVARFEVNAPPVFDLTVPQRLAESAGAR